WLAMSTTDRRTRRNISAVQLLVNCLIMLGRRDDAQHLFHRLLNIRNDLGLLAEEYDPNSGRQRSSGGPQFEVFHAGASGISFKEKPSTPRCASAKTAIR